MFADAGPLGADVDGNEVEFPEAAKVAAPRDGNVKGCADLDAACVAGAGYLVGEPLDIAYLTGEEGEKGVGLAAGAAVQLDLLYKLDDSHQNVNKAADIRGIASLGQQEPFQFVFQ